MGSAGTADEFQMVLSYCFLQYLVTRVTLWYNDFLTLSYPSHLKHLVSRAFLEDGLPEMLSKLGVLDERGMDKSKKHCTGVRPEQCVL